MNEKLKKKVEDYIRDKKNPTNTEICRKFNIYPDELAPIWDKLEDEGKLMPFHPMGWRPVSELRIKRKLKKVA